MENNNRYNHLNEYFKKKFGERTLKFVLTEDLHALTVMALFPQKVVYSVEIVVLVNI